MLVFIKVHGETQNSPNYKRGKKNCIHSLLLSILSGHIWSEDTWRPWRFQ